MTVAALTPYVEYAENGVTLNFAAPFRYGAATGLEVRRQLADGSVAVLTYGAAWNATAGPTDAGGTVTLTSSIAGATLKIRRVTPRAQPTDYVTNDSFPAESHEAALDRDMMILQEQDVDIDLVTSRALLVPEGETVPVLANAAGRATKLMGFDSLGDPIMTPESADAQVLRAELASSTLGLGAALLGVAARPGVTGAQPATLEQRLHNSQVSILEFMTSSERNAVLDGVFGVDVTAKVQAAINACAAEEIGGWFAPAGSYKLSAAIAKGQAAMTGWQISGDGQDTIFKQFTPNTPLFEFTVQDMHTIHWHDMTLAHDGDQTGQANASAFKIIGGGGAGSLYECSFHHLWFQGNYQAIDASGTGLWWGTDLTNIWATVKHRLATLSSTAGKPRCNFSGLVQGGAAGTHLVVANALEAEWSMETLSHQGGLLFDGGGGSHVVSGWSSEVANFPAGTVRLFDVSDSRLLITGEVRLKTMTLQAAAKVYFTRSSGTGGGLVNANSLSFSFAGGIAAQGAGSSFYVFDSTNIARPAEIADIVGEFSATGASPIASLTDVGSTGAAEFVRVSAWADMGRTVRMDDADLTLAVDGPGVVALSKPHTAERDIIMPYDGTGNGTNLFGGWRREFLVLPSSLSAFATRLRRYDDTVTIATIPAGVSGRWELRWDRSNLNPSTGTVGNWTFAYLGPVTTPLQATQTFDPASLALNAATAIQTVTVTGAVLGNFVDASFSLDLAGIAIRAWVSAADTVKYYFVNEAGANPLDLGSGTVTVLVCAK